MDFDKGDKITLTLAGVTLVLLIIATCYFAQIGEEFVFWHLCHSNSGFRYTFRVSDNLVVRAVTMSDF